VAEVIRAARDATEEEREGTVSPVSRPAMDFDESVVIPKQRSWGALIVILVAAVGVVVGGVWVATRTSAKSDRSSVAAEGDGIASQKKTAAPAPDPSVAHPVVAAGSVVASTGSSANALDPPTTSRPGAAVSPTPPAPTFPRPTTPQPTVPAPQPPPPTQPDGEYHPEAP
jgi:hypothetical protein